MAATQSDINRLSQFSPYMENPEEQKLLQDLEASRQKAVEMQKQGISDYEGLLQQHLDKMGEKNKLDLSPLLALTDSWTGSNLARSYARPQDSRSDIETMAQLQQGLQKARGELTDDEMKYLATKAGLLQKADETKAKLALGQENLASLEQRSLNRLQSDKERAGGVNLTPGQKSFDTSFGKDLDEWTSGARETVDKNLNLLKSARDRLAAEDDEKTNISGRVIGRLPDALRPKESLVTQQEVQGAASGALKATLGAAFGEKEGERIMKFSYDPTLPPSENLKKIDAAIAELEGRKINKDAKAQYFMENGTLKGFVDPVKVGSSNKTTSSEKKAAKTPEQKAVSNKPKTVIQNGHTYILNEETGEYE